MIYMGPLKRRGGWPWDRGELLVILLDHVLLMVEQKNKMQQYKVYRRVRYVLHFDSYIVMFYWSIIAHPTRVSSCHRY